MLSMSGYVRCVLQAVFGIRMQFISTVFREAPFFNHTSLEACAKFHNKTIVVVLRRAIAGDFLNSHRV